MIRIRYAGLESKIKERFPKWYSSTAKERWKVLKPLLLELQHGKCSFCERFLGTIKDAVTQASHGHDKAVEHYRPKGKVKYWFPPENWKELSATEIWAPGYDWLQFEPRNLSVSCLTCNQTYKCSYFPIRRALGREEYQSNPGGGVLAQEEPYLIFPAESSDMLGMDPELLISFEGWNPIPHPDLELGSYNYWRAKVTIELMGLRNEMLVKERQERIRTLAVKWALVKPSDSDLVEETHSKHAHASCARRFLEIVEQHPEIAKEIALKACEALEDKQAKRIIANYWQV